LTLGIEMNRLGVIIFLGGIMAAAPLASYAQGQNAQCKPAAPGIRTVGFLTGVAPEKQQLVSFRQGLMDSGYVEDRNIVIDYRWGYAPNLDRIALDRIARDLVSCAPALIVVASSTVAAKAAENATATIPIVFAVGLDPVRNELVKSYDQPILNGNVTGVTMQMATGLKDQLDLLRLLNPQIKQVGLLVSGNTSPQDADAMVKDLPNGKIFEVRGDEQLRGDIFRQAVNEGYDGMIVSANQFFATRRPLIIEQAAAQKVLTLYPVSDYVDGGGLISYGASLPNTYRQAGLYVGKILNGARPDSLPVLRSPPEIAINLNTARALNLTVSTELKTRADKVVGEN
jgi:putative ABC transport system substrate-binding protein